jgi:coiled-coil domain-containing protein 130
MSRPSTKELHQQTNLPASTYITPFQYLKVSERFRNALGNRARKAGEGVLTVRFEMPYAIWCTTCPKPTIIGQGVRFNAEKKKVGNYFSSPIFSFRMKHTVCGGWIEIRTDPKSTAYVVTEGARKRDVGEDRVQEGQIVLRSEEEKERLREDAFAALEVTIEDRQQATVDKTRITDLLGATEEQWHDPFEANRRLRRKFRAERKVREKNKALSEELKDRMSLGIELLEESESDKLHAALVDFGESNDHTSDSPVSKARARGLFEPNSKADLPGGTQSSRKPASLGNQIVQTLRQNTRAAVDPFLSTYIKSDGEVMPRLKRKRSTLARDIQSEQAPTGQQAKIQDACPPLQLVDYESE